MKIKKILCAVDFSEYSEQALKYAAFLSRSHGAKLILLHVIEPLHGSEQYMVLALTPLEIKVKLKDEANNQLSALANNVKSSTKVETAVREGKAFVEIIKKAKEDRVDLIVMGSHGRTGLEHILIGSVAEKVTPKASCPVLIVKGKDTKFKMP
ncbi:MAG: universal stress protein [bacterium]